MHAHSNGFGQQALTFQSFHETKICFGCGCYVDGGPGCHGGLLVPMQALKRGGKIGLECALQRQVVFNRGQFKSRFVMGHSFVVVF